MDFKKMNFNDIVDYCKTNNQVPWLKEIMKTTYPTVDKHKQPVLDEDGKQVYHPITFIELKLEFARKFMPEIIPQAKEKKPSMLDIVNAL